MGAPKQKWTREEESALTSGVLKHGPGKWRTILKDPEYSEVLHHRSNVDLKDKWRNMSVTVNASGSRDKSRLAVKRTSFVPKQEENTLAQTNSVQSDEEMVDAIAGSSALQVSSAPPAKRPHVRLDNLIMEAISTLKEPGGCYKSKIAAYIEDHYQAPLDFQRLLSNKLKNLTSSGKLVKFKRKYRISNSTPLSSRKKKGLARKQRTSSLPSPKTDRDELALQTRSQIETESDGMKSMNVQEAAAVAAQEVAEAEAAMAEAEEAAKQAEATEIEAEAAQAFAEEALKIWKELKQRCTGMVRA